MVIQCRLTRRIVTVGRTTCHRNVPGARIVQARHRAIQKDRTGVTTAGDKEQHPLPQRKRSNLLIGGQCRRTYYRLVRIRTIRLGG